MLWLVHCVTYPKPTLDLRPTSCTIILHSEASPGLQEYGVVNGSRAQYLVSQDFQIDLLNHICMTREHNDRCYGEYVSHTQSQHKFLKLKLCTTILQLGASNL